MTEEKNTVHKSVLLNETIEGLNLSKNAVVVDGTFGGGGHSEEICKRYKGVKIIALDQDQSAWDRVKDRFAKYDVTFVNANFRDMDVVLKNLGISSVNGIILDLGLSSDQLESSGRGFSFMKNEPLLMSMKENPSSEDPTAIEIVNEWGEDSLEKIIYGYGEEKFAKRIAKAIVESRAKKEIKTTFDLTQIIYECVPGVYKRGKIHFATRTFQALRIAVNDELGALKMGLTKGFEVLKKGGRMSVITFHSLEDRIVKNFSKEKAGEEKAILINKKVIVAGDAEIKTNPRARSAKLRIIEKI